MCANIATARGGSENPTALPYFDYLPAEEDADTGWLYRAAAKAFKFILPFLLDDSPGGGPYVSIANELVRDWLARLELAERWAAGKAIFGACMGRYRIVIA